MLVSHDAHAGVMYGVSRMTHMSRFGLAGSGHNHDHLAARQPSGRGRHSLRHVQVQEAK